MATKYPSPEEIKAIFKPMEEGEAEKVFERVHPHVDWTVMGTHPIAGRYTSLEDFLNSTLKRLTAIMKTSPIRIKTRNVIGGGDSEWAVVELYADGVECKNGLKFENTYAWCMRFNEDGQIVQVRAYLDSALIKQILEENEGPGVKSYRAPIV
ncbi:uncharacterized protein J3D65DRAFT_615699 [Phyllosticta citribraziliensis]|uniref:SnoaL-like domain-containing protein n=1 Tax=Phyllosticta citribraziliensis TaxID=989973 RepID=A0ABR1M0P0_9PEZI